MLLAGILCAADGLLGIQIRVLEGEGDTYAVSSHAAHGVTVQVTDEVGKPVPAATVNFLLPQDGPGGAFPNGGKSAIVTTDDQGRAGVFGMEWNATPGNFEIRVVASKGQARAGTIVRQCLSTELQKPEPVASGGEGTFTASHHHGRAWLILGIVAGGAAGGAMYARSASKATATSPPPPVVPVQIGSPTLIVGHP